VPKGSGGSTALNQTRTHKQANEGTATTEMVGTPWADVAHDAAGNVTTMPKPSNTANALTCTYDAWNRLVKVQQGQNTLGEYEFDGLGRWIVKTAGGTTQHFCFHYRRSP